jgi:hypothetical protein
MKYVEITRKQFFSMLESESSDCNKNNMVPVNMYSKETEKIIGTKIHIEKQLDVIYIVDGVGLVMRFKNDCRSYYMQDINS